jgi:hypothetical protein
MFVPHQQLDAATKLINTFGDVFVRMTWPEEPPNGYYDWKNRILALIHLLKKTT